ncbi:MAG: hypothetical protein FWE69_08150, partial [Clostridiales bacterium]|nr:hypothetical protein [Clostridiales bacterium]
MLVGVLVLANVLGERAKQRRAEENLDLSGYLQGTPDPDASPDPDAEQQNFPQAIPPLAGGQSYSVVADSSALPSLLGFNYEIRLNNEAEIYDTNPRKNELSFGSAASYARLDGVTTFGGNHYRNSFSFGYAAVTMEKLSQKWANATGSLGAFAGTDWTGQALLARWSPEVRAVMGLSEQYRNKEGFVEAICPSADGKIYFYDLETGAQTRTPIVVGTPLLGTGTLDPNGYPMLYVGDGICEKNDKGNPVAYLHAVNLITNTVDQRFGGFDYFGKRQDWNAFKASPLIVGDTIVFGAENGVLYLCPLNTKFNAEEASIEIERGALVK